MNTTATLPRRLAGMRSAVVRDALARVQEQFPGLARLCTVDGQRMAGMAASVLRSGLRPLDAQVDRGWLGRCAELARWCAGHQVPLDDLVRAHRQATSTVLSAVWRSCGPGENPAARVLAGRLLADTKLVTKVVSDAYLGNLWLGMGDGAQRRHNTAALLAGTLPDNQPDAPGGYLVAVPAVPDAAPGEEPPIALTVEVEHRLRTVPGVLHLVSGHEVALVLPLTEPGNEARQRGERALAEAVGKLGGLAVTPAGCAYATTATRVPQAAGSARDLGRLAGPAPVDGPLVSTGDLLLERAFDRYDDLAARIRGQLDPLWGEVDLVETLRHLYDQDLDRTRTASALHIHRATLNHRLNRIRELTGIKPTGVVGIRLFSAALTLADGAA
ncbi:hypothetical protein CFN78_17765 [Amycolatopsis antarctica]|uniref:PucR C-terminal helix-turn-helix domain-containing protein n=1 Tax=Amycolatopsis antarctica TaxID=1854586 RepID=A0A263D0M7_9PSEU|nr:helix-turn-helix domain-containing protein [Amycolatopsis antarctica]OZM71983.1 hypothetical protein CFN78_17765 [Amycolatopsis antarctica]